MHVSAWGVQKLAGPGLHQLVLLWTDAMGLQSKLHSFSFACHATDPKLLAYNIGGGVSFGFE